MPWYDERRGPVRERRVDPDAWCVLSPDGAFVAWHPRPEEGAPKGSVRVSDLRSDTDVCSVEGVGPALTAHWLGADRLLVTRMSEGATRASLHEIPSGEALATGMLRGWPGERHSVERSTDGRVLCVTPLGSRSHNPRVTWLVDAETLEVRARIDRPFEFGALHPDGERVATTDIAGVAGRLVTQLFTLPDPSGPFVSLGPDQAICSSLRWVGRDELRVLFRAMPDGRVMLDAPFEVATVDVRRGVAAFARLPADPDALDTALSADGSRVLWLGLDRRPDGVGAYLRAFDPRTGALDEERSVSIVVHASSRVRPAWSRDESAAGLVVARPSEALFCEFGLGSAGARVLRVPPSPAGSLYSYSRVGPWLVEHSSSPGVLRVFDARAMEPA